MSDKKRYLRNYFWNILEYTTSFLSAFLVTPKITESLSTQVFGAYAAVLGFSIFFSYADFGFLGAAYKFACDEYVRGDKEKEVDFLASASFVQFLSYLALSLLLLVFSIYPGAVFKGLTPETAMISSRLFLLLALFSFASIPRRIIMFISEFRIEMYRATSWLLFFNLVNIALVFVIFRSNNSMNVVSYYFFTNLVSFGATISLGYYLFKKWGYSFTLFFSRFRFNKGTLGLLSPFAKASYFSTLMYLLYYELDLIFIGKFISLQALAFYAIGATYTNFFRRLSSTLISPFVPKYNRFYVNNDDAGMRDFYLSNLAVTAPFVFIPSLVAMVLMPQFINAWVGPKYTSSVLIAQLLVGVWLLSPLMDIPSFVVNSKLQIRRIYISSALATLTFWVIVLLFVGRFGVGLVAAAKLLSGWISGLYLIYVGNKLLGLSLGDYSRKVLLPLFPTAIVAILLCLPFTGLETTRSRVDFLMIVLIEGCICAVAFIAYVLFSRQFRVAVGEEHFTLRSVGDRLSGIFRSRRSPNDDE